jgi:5-methylcytosine-specific restriction protein A
MPLADLTRPAVLAAIEEHDRLGREEFLRRYGFGPAREYRLLFNGREYDSKRSLESRTSTPPQRRCR